MSIWLDTWRQGWRPQDKRSRSQWAYDYVRPPNSARGEKLDVSLTPWLREPVDLSTDNAVKEMVLLMPTGAGKTTMIDAVIPHAVCEDPGGILLALQTDTDAKEYVEERLMPLLKKIPQVQHVLDAMDRHAIRKDAVMFPHMPLYMGGANLTNLQRKSVRYCLGDEVWRWKHGHVKELRARTHDRWNQRVVLLSQGGLTHILTDSGLAQTELDAAWLATDQREWNFECPECKLVQRFRFKSLRYETVEKEDGTLDEVGIFQSAKFLCQGKCETSFNDTIFNRRTLAASGRYIPTNLHHLPGKVGWHCNALTLYYLPWGTLAVEQAQAHRARKHGDEEPIRIYRQKRGAENYREEESTPPSPLATGDYSFADYANGEPIDGERDRFQQVDVQKDHFWVTVRAWRTDATSRLVYEGKISTWEAVREHQLKMKVGDWKTGVDCSYNVDDEVSERCAQYKWFMLKGDGADTFAWHPKRGGIEHRHYSTFRNVRCPSGRTAKMVLWSNRGVKQMMERFRDGKRELFEVPSDVSEDYKISMFSEAEKDTVSKRTKRVERRFVQIGSRPNHKWDCECMGIVMALIFYILADRPSTGKNSKAEVSESLSTDGLTPASE